MANAVWTGYVAECFWAGVQEADLRELDQRIEASVGAVAGNGELVRYRGWFLVIDDEVLLVLLEGPIAKIRQVAELAEIPFGRILQVAHSPWPHSRDDEKVLQ